MVFQNLKFQKYKTQFFAVLAGSSGLIANGMEFGWASPAIPKLMEADSPVPDILHDPSAVDLIQTLYMGGSIVGMPFSFILLQYLGRKKALLIAESVSFICWLLVASATTLEQLYVARFFSGLAANAVYVGLPMYSAEISEPPIRGFFGAMIYCMSMFGVLVAYSIVPYMPIYASSTIAACISLVMLISFSFKPESPYFLLTKNKNEEAEISLKYLRLNKAEVNIEIEELKSAVARQESERGRVIDLILIPSNRKATIVMMLLNIAQNMAGVSVLVMNAQTLLKEASKLGGIESPMSDEIAAIVFGITMLIAGILGSLLIDKYGRRILLISSSALSALCLALLSGYYYSAKSFTEAGFTWVPLFTLIAYAFSFKCGLGVVPIVLTGELFPTSVKAMGMVLADMWFTILATISLQVYLATTYLGPHVPFTVFAVCAAVSAILIALYVPETKGKSLEEIQLMLKGKSIVNTNKSNDTN